MRAPRPSLPGIKTENHMPAPNAPVSEPPPPLTLPSTLSASKNRQIKDLAACITRYKLLYPTFVQQKRANAARRLAQTLDATGVALLDRMSFLCLTYLAAKPPGVRKDTGKAKWNSVVDFTDQLKAHSNYFDVNLLAGDFRAGEQGVNYWLERLDPANNALDQWKDFVSWARKNEKKEFQGDSAERSNLEYLNEADRERYRVHVVNGLVCYAADGSQLDTSSGAGSYSQVRGVYIYVCSARTRNIYTFNSVEAQLHHSSFLKGEPVLGAGDWRVIQGKVQYVNALSGHYRPSFQQMRTFAQACQVFWNPRTVVSPWFDRKHDATLMQNLARLGERAPVLKTNDQMLQSADFPKLDPPAFRHDAKPPLERFLAPNEGGRASVASVDTGYNGPPLRKN